MNAVLRLPIAGLLLLCMISAAPPADAHRLRAAITTVLFNDHSSRIEVMHRFYLHDAEHALTELIGRGADLFDSIEDRQRFAVYVHERFSLGYFADGVPAGGAFADGVPAGGGVTDTPSGEQNTDGERLLALQLIGAEIEDDSLWVYEAIAYPEEPIAGLLVSQRALLDIWPDQVNTVNVERAGRVSTLTFRADTPALSTSF